MNEDLYLSFVRERHRIWEQRQRGEPQPWTTDPVLASKKFTNVFRVLDPGSQFALELTEGEQRDVLMRLFLYRHTGRPEPWEFFNLMHGRYPLVEDLALARETLKTYRGTARLGSGGPSQPGGKTRTNVITYEHPIFTSAYLVFPQSQTPGTDKLDSILDLTGRLFTPGSPGDIVPAFLAARSQEERFRILRSNPGVGDFMAMQILTDWGYTTEFREDTYVVAGPGATKGCALLSSKPARAVIGWAAGHEMGVHLQGREPSLMDVQNTFCEFFKYHRYRAKPLVEFKPYRPAHPGPQAAPRLPRNW